MSTEATLAELFSDSFSQQRDVLDLEPDVLELHRRFPHRPLTMGPQVNRKTLPDDPSRGWTSGVWYCGTAYQPAKLYGQYPQGFLERALALFPTLPPDEILHCPSGTVSSQYGVTVDLHADEVRKPQIVASAENLPFRDHSFSLVLSDPPYADDEENYKKQYDCPRWPMRRAMKEFHRVLKPGGYLGMLDTRYPVFRRENWDLTGTVGVITGALRRTRLLSLFKRSANDWQEASRTNRRNDDQFDATPADLEGLFGEDEAGLDN